MKDHHGNLAAKPSDSQRCSIRSTFIILRILYVSVNLLRVDPEEGPDEGPEPDPVGRLDGLAPLRFRFGCFLG